MYRKNISTFLLQTVCEITMQAFQDSVYSKLYITLIPRPMLVLLMGSKYRSIEKNVTNPLPKKYKAMLSYFTL